MHRFLRITSLGLIVLLPVAVTLWVWWMGMTHLWWGVPGSVAAALFLYGGWYLVFGATSFRSRWRRVLSVALVMALLMGVTSRLIRYRGSASGSSFPKFSWVWSDDSGSGAEEVAIGHPAGASEWPPDFPKTEELVDALDFLGPERDGMWPAPPFGTDWSTHPPRLLWRRPLGKAWSSFTISGSRVLTQQQSVDDEQVLCLDLRSGEDLWIHSDPQTRLLLERAENGGSAMGGDGPRATPLLHGERVFTMGSTGIVHCLDLASGKELWTRHLLRDLGLETQRWGMANTPLLLSEENLLILAGSDEPGPTLIAVDPENGENRWIYQGSGASYSSPRVVDLCGRRQIVSVNRQDVCGLDPATGHVLWTYSWPGIWPKVGQAITRSEDRVIVTASYGAGSLLLKIEKDRDEMFSVRPLWKTNSLKTKFSSVVVQGDAIYGLDEGRLTCVSLETGRRLWKGEKFGFGQHLLFGSYLLVQTEAGDVVLGRVSPEGFSEKGRIPALSSMTWNVPVIAGRILLVRNDREASAWLLPPP